MSYVKKLITSEDYLDLLLITNATNVEKEAIYFDHSFAVKLLTLLVMESWKYCNLRSNEKK